MTQSKHTELPYRYDPDNNAIYGAECDIVVVYEGQLQYKGDGEFIARVCNSHYELLEALEDLAAESAETFAHWPDLKIQVCEAIAKAKGGE
jgi:hypothetical protein